MDSEQVGEVGQDSNAAGRRLRPYAKPELVEFGSVRDLTRKSGNTNDSGQRKLP